jgi:signal transduction histidine kinase
MNNATLYFVSTLGLIIAVSYTLLFSITKIQRIYIPVNMMPISFSFEVILLSIVLIYRFRNTENQKKKLENELKKEQLLSAGYQITIQEKERSRIAKDLHDEIGSNLANLKMQLDQLDNKDPQTASKISSMLEVISITNKSLSAITYNLMPPSFNTTPFPSVLNTFFEKIKNNKSIYFEFYIHNYLQAFKKEDELIIYRILLELSHNIIKHSKANSASVQLIYTRNSVNIIAEDNGIGIENQKKGLGLESINSRVKYLEGTIEIDSTTSGTLISISIPYKSKQL